MPKRLFLLSLAVSAFAWVSPQRGIHRQKSNQLGFKCCRPTHLHMVSLPQSLRQVSQTKWYIWTLLSLSSTAGLAAESTRIGAALSSPLVTMFITLFLCNTNLLPAASPVYDVVLSFLVPLAIPLLLLDADIRKVFRSSERLLLAFLIGSVGTCLGTLVAYKLVPMKGVVGASKIAAALCARHIGGAVNFVAVSDVLDVPPDLVAAALAADNVVVAIYFSCLFAMTAAELPSSESRTKTPKSDLIEKMRPSVDISSLSSALSLSLAINLTAQVLKTLLGFSPIVSVSFIAVILATLFPSRFQKLSPAGGKESSLFFELKFLRMPGCFVHAAFLRRHWRNGTYSKCLKGSSLGFLPYDVSNRRSFHIFMFNR